MNRGEEQVPPRQSLMRIELQAVDEAGQPVFWGHTEVDAIALMVMAETREEMMRSKGRAFAEGVIPFLGAQLVEAAKSRRDAAEVDRRAIEVAMAVWLVDSVYDGLTAEVFMKSNLRFTMYPSGAVQCDRLPAA